MAGYIGTQPVPQATQHRESFTATASQTSFATAGYTAGFVDVYLNGVHLLNGTDYTATNGSDIVLTTGAAAGDVLEVISYSTFEVNSQSFTGDTTVANLDVTGTFTGTNLTLSGGVYLGGTGAANLLDDYEEGTWTPTLQSGDGCFTSVTSISSVSGNYTKVGNQVTAWYKFSVGQSITDAEGILRIDGLPFTASTTNYGSGGAQLYISHGSNNSEVASAGASSTTLYVYRGTVNGTTGTPSIQGFVTYQTAS